MTETRAAVKLRLQAEGRWDSAKDFRDGQKAAGVAPAEAWRQMVAAFPPLMSAGQQGESPSSCSALQDGAPPVPTPEPSSVKKRRRKRRSGQSVQWRDEAEWVYLSMGEDNHDGHPPSSGALAMLKWAKANPAEFFRSLSRFVPSRSEQNAAAKKQEEEARPDQSKELVEQWLENYTQEEERQRRARVRNWTLDECRKRLEEAVAGVEHDDYNYDPVEETPEPPSPTDVPVQPQTEYRMTRPTPPPPKRLQPCPYCERDRLAGRTPLPNCACCAYIAYMGIEMEPAQTQAG
jgi:hypothetical protein